MSRTIILNSGARGFEAHPRNWRNFWLCYPVISRRSRGLSIGINLNPDRVCNFDCIYCEVDRRDFRPGKTRLPLPPKNTPRIEVNLDEVEYELTQLLQMARDGSIWQEPEFSTVAPELRRVNDIAFSGDGEPTTYPRFVEAVQVAIKARAGAGFNPDEVKLVLITNATQLHRANVKEGLHLLHANNGEIWAKLDAGTAEYYELIDKTNVPFERILRNLRHTAHAMPINIQTCMLRVRGEGPSAAEVEAYCQRLCEILDSGGRILMVQLYTVARQPPYEWVTSLPDNELYEIAHTITQRTGLTVETYGGNVGL
ncbi:MAG TPA: radical SAM protein [Chloroflexia bacterium]|nr:radical SAM protein [Chloroflexia bacterium]